MINIIQLDYVPSTATWIHRDDSVVNNLIIRILASGRFSMSRVFKLRKIKGSKGEMTDFEESVYERGKICGFINRLFPLEALI